MFTLLSQWNEVWKCPGLPQVLTFLLPQPSHLPRSRSSCWPELSRDDLVVCIKMLTVEANGSLRCQWPVSSRPGAPGSSTREDKGFVSCPVAACGVQLGGTAMPGKEIVTLLLMIVCVVLIFFSFGCCCCLRMLFMYMYWDQPPPTFPSLQPLPIHLHDHFPILLSCALFF